MRRVLCSLLVGFVVLPCAAIAADAPSVRVTDPGKLPEDARLGKLRDLYDKYHPWAPPATKEAWEAEARKIRERVLVSQGLWPMPAKTPLNAVVHGKIERDDYTVEKVFFQSYPGHYVTGSLYRPKSAKGKLAGVLCPHGHWSNGRFYDAGDKEAAAQLSQGAEKFESGAHFPLQARMVSLARLGCVVFHYDMVGVADSKGIAHRDGLLDAEAELRLQNHMGLQTWNSIRALDFLTSLPDVDGSRIGVTGASGGGTQTFMLAAVDPRPTAVFPAVMVSTDMQGGCVCENADYLRIGINNIALSALFAPKPQAMSGADDWTINIETKGLPELKQVYALYGKADLVHAKAYPQFKHNYNQVAREMMEAWFNEHLKLGHSGPIAERSFEPLSKEQLSVWDEAHPVPNDVKDAKALKAYLTEVEEKQFEELKPTTPEKLAAYKTLVGTAARVLLDEGVPAADALETDLKSSDLDDTASLTKGTIGRKGAGEKVPFAAVVPKKFSGTVLLSASSDKGNAAIFKDGKLVHDVRKWVEAGHAFAGVDVFLTGEYVAEGKDPAYPKVNATYGGYTFGYNRPVLSNRVRDILTAVSAARQLPGVKRVVLIGKGEAATWLLLARSLAGDKVDDAILLMGGYVPLAPSTAKQDPNFLPGGLRYGGFFGLAAAGAPAKLMLLDAGSVPEKELGLLGAAYSHGAGALTTGKSSDASDVLKRLAE